VPLQLQSLIRVRAKKELEAPENAPFLKVTANSAKKIAKQQWLPVVPK
jgi:hypothetical protein